MTLLERDDLLARLTAEWSLSSAGEGRVVFVEGEAGIGKTSLVRAFARTLQREAPVFSGACEALQTPRPLGALCDIAERTGGPLKALLDAGGHRHHVFVAFMDLLRVQPALVVLEDLHWADEATLDLLRHAGRRIAGTRSLLVGTYRSDELVPVHPLRAVLGDLATAGPVHLRPAPLSPAAVGMLCQGLDVDALEVHQRTGGNPFFVTEVLAAPAAEVPGTVQDAVLARAGRLSLSARAVLDAAAIAGPRVELPVLEALAAAESAAIEEGLATGVLRVDGGAITFRHELARQAVLRAIVPTRAMSLHRMMLGVLQAKAITHALPRLALHAEGAGDAEAVRHWAPLAAREAAARGAHAQAAQHWARALAHTEGDAARAQVLDPYAEALRTCGQIEAAIDARQQAARIWRASGDAPRAIRSSVELAQLQLLSSKPELARQALQSARALLAAPGEPSAPYGPHAQSGSEAIEEHRPRIDLCEADLLRHTLDFEAAVALAAPVLALAERHADRARLIDALNTLGAALMGCGRGDEAVACLERALALAEASGADLWAARSLSNLALGCMSLLRLSEAEGYLQRGTALCADKDLDAPRLFQLSLRAGLHLLLGRWDKADAAAQEVIGNPRAMAIARVRANTVLGRLRARRGEAGAREALAEARRLGGDGLVSMLSAHLAEAERAWHEGRADDVAREAAAGLALLPGRPLRGAVTELLVWRHLSGAAAGAVDATPAGVGDHPCALEAAGRWQEAASRWRALGCPFETARALAQGDEAAQREALAIAEALGARPLAERLRQRLHDAGVRGLPRRPRAATRGHPAELTAKEVAVLKLLAAGLRNKEIAARLSRSPRTIDHHLESVFGKLGVATRAEAVSAAFRLGVVVSARDVPLRGPLAPGRR